MTKRPQHQDALGAQDQLTAMAGKMAGFDAYMAKILKDWNVPGVGVGIVVKDRLIFAKGYGYRDYEKKLPITPKTLFQIASNTKLFTAIAIGLLVEEGKLDWDKPLRQFVPEIKFHSKELDDTVTIRDMLAHRTGVSRHDFIWYKSKFTRKELFERLKYLEPSQSLRQGFLYNNLMYAACGYVIELLSGQTWEAFLRKRIFGPLGMRSTMFSVREMVRCADHFVPYNEKRDVTALYKIPYYDEEQGVGPAGSIISNIGDLSQWLIALMNDGSCKGKRVIPSDVVHATVAPTSSHPNELLEHYGYREMLNPGYGMGRHFASYQGHYLTYHGGHIDGIYSQISCMPYDGLGVIVFAIGDHSGPLPNMVSFNIYERLLGLDQTPWSERWLKVRTAAKKMNKEGRMKAGGERIANTKPSHPIRDYTGEFENPAYGIFKVSLKNKALRMVFHTIALPLKHYHYDRFDSLNDERYGLWSLNFATNPQGEIDRITISLDEKEVSFVRKPNVMLSDLKTLRRYTGKYDANGPVLEVIIKNGNMLCLVAPGEPHKQLIPHKEHIFRRRDYADRTVEFVVDNKKVTAMKLRTPSGEFLFKKKTDDI